MGKHCHDEGCPGVYEDDHTCSHCGETDRDYLQYVYLEIPADVSAVAIQVKLDDEGVVVDAYDTPRVHAIASTAKMYREMRLSVRHWDANGDISVKDLLTQFKNGNRQDVITTLLEAHPCVTAMLLTVGMLEGHLRQEDCNIITNMLVDAKTEENE